MITLETTDELRNDRVILWALSQVEKVASEPAEIELVNAPNIVSEGYELTYGGDSPESSKHLIIRASDSRGFSYAMTEFAGRLVSVGGKASRLQSWSEEAQPAVPKRGIQRTFSSVHEDSEWFHSREFWTEYLDYIAAQRFNRFHLALGMHYNYGADKHGATDNYLCLAYPFLFDVDGYSVRAEGVDAEERKRNLEALKYIARETERRGMNFQMGLWNHAYDYGRDSQHWYPILGLSEDNHAEYCAAGITRLLQEIPEISGFSFRVHYEGGIHETGHEIFWDKMFQAISDSGRNLEVDMHAKGVDKALVDAVQKPGIDPVISGKHWAEHMGLPYHQTTIRVREGALPLEDGETVMGVTEFLRKFTRYGYGDFLDEDRDIAFMFRMWPGTQRLLLWGDPAIAAGYGRQATFGGARGYDYCEPLYFKGRKGSGVPGGREVYARDDLKMGIHDWQKYKYTYLLWGRNLYDPETKPFVWQRFLEAEYGAESASAAEEALSNLSRILPLLTVTHAIGASCNRNWLENPVYLPISQWAHSYHYADDTALPANWSGAVAFDSTLFSSVGEYVDSVVAGNLDAKYTPLEVASWIQTFTDRGEAALARFQETSDLSDPQTNRTLIDLGVLVELGHFFATQYRAAVEYSVFEKTGAADSIVKAVELLEEARAHWIKLTQVVEGVYCKNLKFGPEPGEYGHWADQIPNIDEDLRILRLERDRASQVGAGESATVIHRDSRESDTQGFSHVQPRPYDRGSSIPVRLGVDTATNVDSVTLFYRHLDQSKQYEKVDMVADNGGFDAEIPGSYTADSYPLAYFFEVTPKGKKPIFFPGFLDETLSNQPYYTLGSNGKGQ